MNVNLNLVNDRMPVVVRDTRQEAGKDSQRLAAYLVAKGLGRKLGVAVRPTRRSAPSGPFGVYLSVKYPHRKTGE